jgi:cardiolipin synthase
MVRAVAAGRIRDYSKLIPNQPQLCRLGALLAALALAGALTGCSTPRATKQQSLDEWRALTGPTAPSPRVFVKGETVRFYFPVDDGMVAFQSHWTHVRIPTSGYRVHSALLRWDQKLKGLPKHERSWHEARVIAGLEWRRLATNIIEELTPRTPAHAAYYQAFLADGVLFRDRAGVAHFVPLGQEPKDVTIEHQFSVEETLDVMSRVAEDHLARLHPGSTLFVIMAPDVRRFTQPLLIDRQQKRCVLFNPSALYDFTERGVTPTTTAQGLWAILPESHGLALLKNPVSSAFRLADLAVATVVRFVRLPLPKPGKEIPPVRPAASMDSAGWEAWLDRYTGTRSEPGSLDLLIDGEQFFTRFHEAVAQSTNHISLNVYIFDKDDVAIEVADQLKARSSDLAVKVLLDRMGSIGAGGAPPATPLPEKFVPPSSIISYLREDSQIKVRKFLNPWFSSDHVKVFLFDGWQAFLGGMNFGREYRYEWHDLMVEVHGPIVHSLEEDFQRAWAHAGSLGDLAYMGALIDGKEIPDPNQAGVQSWIPIRRLPTKTMWKPFSTAVMGALAHAQRRVFVENPYLFDKRAILALVRARSRGVDVRVILPRVNDFKAGGRGNLVIANYLIQRGVRVYFYPGMTHVKALLVDDWACVGSANMNHLSLRVNQEQNVGTSDPGFVSRLEHELFEADFARSHELREEVSVDWVDFLADFLLEGF